eukprot:758517-Hanusia_phi.AAC.3
MAISEQYQDLKTKFAGEEEEGEQGEEGEEKEEEEEGGRNGRGGEKEEEEESIDLSVSSYGGDVEDQQTAGEEEARNEESCM